MSYVHPADQNLVNLHKSMQYNSDGDPAVRVVLDPSQVGGTTPPTPGEVTLEQFNVDMFGRLKVSEPFTLVDLTHRYKLNDEFIYSVENGATVTHLTNESCAALSVTSTLGSKVYFETRKVFPYQPGKSLQVMQSIVLSAAKTGLRQRAGYFSTQNGIFLELNGNSLGIVKRSYVTGSVIDTFVSQSNWNVDKLDGTGPSGYILDITKAQVLWTEYEWLGVGTVNVGFVIDEQFIICHKFRHANVIASAYMTTATLPMRYEIENVSVTASSSTLKQICATVISNGGYSNMSKHWTISRTAELTHSTTAVPLVAIRLAPGRTDAVVIPTDVSVLGVTPGTYIWEIYRNPTVVGGTWVPYTASGGNVEYNITATSITGGTATRDGFMTTTNQAKETFNSGTTPNFANQIGRDINGVSEIICLTVRTLSGTGSSIGSFGWTDIL